jgi:hypothetical protein
MSEPLDTLSILFTTDPLTHTPPEVEALVIDLQRRRNDFAAEEARKAALPPKTKGPKVPGPVPTSIALGGSVADLSFEDL